MLMKMKKMCKKKHHGEKAVLIASVVALLAIAAHQCMKLHELMKKKHNPIGDTVEQLQHCFERLMER